MAIKQNALDLAYQFSLATKAVELSVFVDDTHYRADTVKEPITIQVVLYRGGFILSTNVWNSSNPFSLTTPKLKDTPSNTGSIRIILRD